jgi:hypothetical protein
MKGTWELRNDFMSGPFINYAILDRKIGCCFLEGFCYSPSKERFNAPIGIHYKISFHTKRIVN